MPTRITTYCPASSIFPDATAEYTANGCVLVFPLIFPAIIAVDFDMDEGIVGFLGSSGCGKSMTLKCIAGIETPDEGRIVLDDEVLFDKKSGINLSPQKRKVGYLFQNYA